MYTASITLIYQIKACGSQTCGEAKEKTKSFVETMYGFESGHSKKAIAANRRLAEELKLLRYDISELQEMGGGVEMRLQKLRNGIGVFHYIG